MMMPKYGTPANNTRFSSPAPATGGFTFGNTSTPATTSNLNFTFGTNPTTTPQSSSLFLGSTSTTATTTTPSLFSASATSTAPGTGLTFGTPTATTSGLLSGTTTSAPTATGGLSFNSTTAASLFGTGGSGGGGGGGGGGLFGAKPLTSNQSTVATTTSNKGLGGLDVSVSNKGLSQGSNSSTAAKENLLPNELMQTIESFKSFVKTQEEVSAVTERVFSSNVPRGTPIPLNRCAEDTASLIEMLTTLAGAVQRDRSSTEKLKQDTAKALQNAEIAQRTHDTPPGLQYENNAPLLFFMELAENFERDLMVFRSQIETTEKHIQTMMSPKTLTPQELTMAMSKLHESFVALAGRLQSVHSKVQQQKEQYLNLRKYVLKDSTNVFEDLKMNAETSRNAIGKITSGPTPFGTGYKSFLSSTTLNASQSTAYGSTNPLAWGTSSTPLSSSNLSSMKPPTAGLNFNPPSNLTAPLSTNETTSSFQLQKPPVGLKRGKH